MILPEPGVCKKARERAKKRNMHIRAVGIEESFRRGGGIKNRQWTKD